MSKEEIEAQYGQYKQRGEIALAKNNPGAHVYATFIFNQALHCAIRLKDSSKQMKMIDAIQEVEERFIESCHGQKMHLYKQVISKYQREVKQVQSIVRMTEQEIKKSSIELVEEATFVQGGCEQVTVEMKKIVAQLLRETVDCLGVPPCGFAVLGLGSMACKEMTSFSDFEFALLIESSNSTNKDYFKHLAELLIIKLINIRETIFPTLSIEKVNQGNHLVDPKDNGFTIDGMMYGIAKNPLGYPLDSRTEAEKAFELIKTAEEMSLYHGKEHQSLEEQFHLSTVLYNSEDLFGQVLGADCKAMKYDPHLVEQYKMASESILDENRRQQVAVAALKKALVGLTDREKEWKLIDVKKVLYYLPNMIINNLRMYFGITSVSTWECIDELVTRGIFSVRGGSNIKTLISLAMQMRLRSYITKRREEENVNANIEQRRVEREELNAFYTRMAPFINALKASLILKSEIDMSCLQNEFFYDQSDCNLMERVTYRFLEFKKLTAKLKQRQTKGEETKEEVASLSRLARAYHVQRKYERALPLYEQVLKLDKVHFGQHHPNVANGHYNMAIVYKAQGKYAESLIHFQQVLEIGENYFGQDHPNLANSHHNMAIVYKAQGKYEESLTHFQQALEIRKNRFGQHHISVAHTYYRIAEVHILQKKYKEASNHYEQTLEIYELYCGQNLSNVANFKQQHLFLKNIYSDIADVYKIQGRYTESLAYYEQALEIIKAHFEEHDLDIAKIYYRMAEIYHFQGKDDKALVYCEQALEIFKAYFGQQNLNVANIYHQIAHIYQSQKKDEKALTHFQKALEIYEAYPGKYNSNVTCIYKNMADIHKAQENYEEALTYFEQALKIGKAHYEQDHPDIADVYYDMATLYFFQKKYTEALTHFQQVLKIDKAHCVEDTLMLANTYYSIANIHKAQENYEEALTHLQQALGIYKAHCVEDTRMLANTYYSIANIYRFQKKYEEALTHFQQALEIDKAHYGQDHPDVADDYCNMATVYISQKKYEEALAHFEQALKIYKNHFGEHSPEVEKISHKIAMYS